MSYTQLYYHIVFRTYNSEATICEDNKRILFSYILRICETEKWKLVRINSYLDHIHILLEIKASDRLSEVVQKIKGASSAAFKGSEHFPEFKGWNKGYGAFSVGYREVPIVKQYIINQEIHHHRLTTEQELNNLLKYNGLNETGYVEW